MFVDGITDAVFEPAIDEVVTFLPTSERVVVTALVDIGDCITEYTCARMGESAGEVVITSREDLSPVRTAVNVDEEISAAKERMAARDQHAATLPEKRSVPAATKPTAPGQGALYRCIRKRV